jgi:hypothetical protein
MADNNHRRQAEVRGPRPEVLALAVALGIGRDRGGVRRVAGDAILLAEPATEIDEVTALAAERPQLVVVADGYAAARRTSRTLGSHVASPSAAERASR